MEDQTEKPKCSECGKEGKLRRGMCLNCYRKATGLSGGYGVKTIDRFPQIKEAKLKIDKELNKWTKKNLRKLKDNFSLFYPDVFKEFCRSEFFLKLIKKEKDNEE
jgi:hypothetical protein